MLYLDLDKVTAAITEMERVVEISASLHSPLLNQYREKLVQIQEKELRQGKVPD